MPQRGRLTQGRLKGILTRICEDYGMKRLALLLVLLSGCDSPSLRMAGAAHRVVEVGGSRFGVHWLGDEVEVYRLSREFLPRLGPTSVKAGAAIRLATGCAVVPGSLDGDVALMTAEIDCS